MSNTKKLLLPLAIACIFNTSLTNASYFSKFKKKITSIWPTKQLAKIDKNMSPETVEKLLKQGANPNAISNRYFPQQTGRTVLHAAINLNKPTIIKLLLKFGADPFITSKKVMVGPEGAQKTFDAIMPIQYANLNTFKIIFEHLIQSGKIKNQTIWPIIMDLDIPHIGFILKNIKNYTQSTQKTLLTMLSLNNYVFLREATSYITHYTPYLPTYIPIIDLYLSYLPESINAQDHDFKDTALLALFHGIISKKDFDKISSLINLLMEHGADPYIKNADNKTVFDLFKNEDITNYLITLYKKYGGRHQEQQKELVKKLSSTSKLKTKKIKFKFNKKTTNK